MNFQRPVYICEQEVKEYLSWEKLIPATEKVMKAISDTNRSTVVQPPRTLMHIPDKNGVLLTMPAFFSTDNALACKIVTAYPDNSKKGLPSVLGTVLLFDQDTGKVLAIIEGNEITARRTAAASVVATKYLHNGNDILAVLGSGTQARSHIESLDNVFHFKEIRVWNHNDEGAKHLARDFQKLGKHVTAYTKAEDCVKDADVIVTATYATSPILRRSWVKPGVHINAVGAGVNHHSELDTELYKSAMIYTDTMAAARVELKGLNDMGVDIVAEIGEVINGTKHAAQENITVFHSLGMAVEDVVSAKIIYDCYKKNASKQ